MLDLRIVVIEDASYPHIFSSFYPHYFTAMFQLLRTKRIVYFVFL